jgi:transposase
MARHYVGGDRDQLFLLPVSMRDWLDEGHLAWFVLDVVAVIDTSAFHARHRNDGPGRPAYNPDMMLGLMFYAYGMGIRSSRRIEALCRTDAAFKVIAGGSVPDHATLARFLVDHAPAIEDVFVEVLRLCAAAGLVSVGAIAVDGTKMGCDASLGANRGRSAITAELERLRGEVEAIVAQARATDAAEDSDETLFALDRLPDALAARGGRRGRLEAALADIEAADAADAAISTERAGRAEAAAAQGRRLMGPKTKDPHAGLTQAAADVAAVQTKLDDTLSKRLAGRSAAEVAAAAQGRKLKGPTPTKGLRRKEQNELERVRRRLATAVKAAADAVPEERKANITDPDSRIMKTATSYLQGYNAQAAVNQNQIVVAVAVTQDANDVGQYQPMVTATQTNLAAIGVTEAIGVVLADAGYWSDSNATAAGPDRLIATVKNWKQRQAARQMGTTSGPPPHDATPIQAMEHRLRTPEGADTYKQRSHTVEPVFGDTKQNRAWRNFRRRGLSAAASEWALINTSHNLAKLFNHHRSTPTHQLT